jgi:hypothetical protein
MDDPYYKASNKALALLHRSNISWDDAYVIAKGTAGSSWKYTFLDGVTYMVTDATELAKKLYENTWFLDRTKTTVLDYLADFSKRAYMVYGVWLNYNTPEHFAADLISYGIVRVEKVVAN